MDQYDDDDYYYDDEEWEWQRSVPYGKCHRYARFMQRLSLKNANYIFWFLFLFQILCLVIIVQLYSSVQQKYAALRLAQRDSQNSKQLESMKLRVRRSSKRRLAQSLFLFILLLCSTIMQVFAAHNILFCHEESLMHLYFPVWTVFAIGITFTMLGCCVTQLYALRTMKLPVFGIALGTPVLVVSAVTHLLWNGLIRRKKPEHDIEDGLQPPPRLQPTPSQTTTLVPPKNQMSQVDLINSTISLANGPVIQIWSGEEPLPTGANAIGATSQGYLIVEHIHPSSSTSSESSRSSTETPATARGPDEHLAAPDVPAQSAQDEGLTPRKNTTRTVKFQKEAEPCCPGH